MMINSIALIEDNEKICQHIVEEIKAHFKNTEVYSFYSGEDAIAFLSTHPTDISLFDINLPGISGIECIRQLKTQHPDMQMIVLTVLDDVESVFEALKAGAVSYLLKTTPSDKLIEAIHEVWDGGSPMTSQIARKLISFINVQEGQRNEYLNRLSNRERDILELLSKGLSYKEISISLFISLETVRTHIRNIYEKLQVHSRSAALRKLGIN